MNEPRFPILSPNGLSQVDRSAGRPRRLAGLVLGTTLLGVMATSTLVDAAPSSARQIERRALDAATPDTGTSVAVHADNDREVPVRSPEVLSIDCAAPAPVAGHRIHIGCSWTLPTEAPVRQLTLWRSVDGAARERVATFGWPFENSYRDVVPAGTQRVAYAIIGTNGAGRLVARSRADVVRLPAPPSATVPTRIEPVPHATTPTTPEPVPEPTTPTTIESRPVSTDAPRTIESRPVSTDAPTVLVAGEPARAEAAPRTVQTQPSAASKARAGSALKQRGDHG